MSARSFMPRLTDMIEAIERIREILGDMPLEEFERDWRRQLNAVSRSFQRQAGIYRMS